MIPSSPTRGSRSHRHRDRRLVHERGATLVEYAMLVALVAVVSLGAIQALNNNASDELADRGGNAGAPDLDSTGVTAPPGGGGTGGGTGGGSTSPPINVSISTPSGCWSGSQNNWTANFNLVVTDTATGLPVNQAIVTARLLRYDGATLNETITPPPRETNPDGTVPYSLLNLKENGSPGERTNRVVFELVSISGDDPPINFTVPVPAPSAQTTRGTAGQAC